MPEGYVAADSANGADNMRAAMCPPVVLTSWKDIAAFLGKGVRTVQRWERQLRLPIHRPANCESGVVIAYPEELFRWVNRSSPTDVARCCDCAEHLQAAYAVIAELQVDNARLTRRLGRKRPEPIQKAQCDAPPLRGRATSQSAV